MKTALSEYAINEWEIGRFWDRVKKTDGCWRWGGWINPDGYGVVWIGGASRLAHRIAYQLTYGPMPEGLPLDHVKELGCLYHDCVRPDHLEPVTTMENNRRADPGRFGRNKTHCPAGHPYSVENVRYYRTSRSCVACSRDASRRYRARKAGQAIPLRRAGMKAAA